jgi:sRNA-binding regulator protein Hfq
MNQTERNYIYNQLLMQISENKDKFLESDIGVKKIKVIAKLFRDSGIESKGEIELVSNYTILYKFYNDRQKRTDVSIIRTPSKNFFNKEEKDEIPILIEK